MKSEIVLRRKREINEKKLADLLIRKEELTAKREELLEQVEQAETEEALEEVETKLKEVSEEEKETEEEEKKVEGLIEELDEELDELSERKKSVKTEKRKAIEKRGGTTLGANLKVNGVETRAQILERINKEEVQTFYRNLQDVVMKKRALTDVDLTIPEEIVTVLNTLIGEYSKLKGEVYVQPLQGTGRVIIDGAIPKAIWTEMCDPVQELESGFSMTEIDGYKVSGYIPLCNAHIEDSMINLVTHVEEKIAMAIAKAIDHAVMVGEGAAGKQPEGIITALEGTDREVTVGSSVAEIVQAIGMIDDGEDGHPLGEITATMRRSTYYKHIITQTMAQTSDGRYIMQPANNYALPDGTRVILSSSVPENTIVLGDLKAYLLGERAGVKLATSTDVRFIQDQTVVKGTARYDGKVVDENKFVVLKIEEGQTEAP